MTSVIAQKLMDEETEARLINWGKWLTSDNTYQKLNFPQKASFTIAPTKNTVAADLDAEWIAHIVSTLAMSNIGKSSLYAFVLKVEYVDRVGKKMPHVSQRAADVRNRFNRRCGESTYYKHLSNAKKLVQMLAGSIVN